MVIRDGNLNKFVFCAPSNPGASIWRYMDLPKYISMLSKRALFFANTRSFKDDPFEGSWPAKILEFRRQTSKKALEDLYTSALKKKPQEKWSFMPIDEVLEMQEKYRSWEKDYTFVNCWHLGEKESFAMWKIYGVKKKAIAIRTTFSKLEKEIVSSPSLAGFGSATDFLSIGLVRYGDFGTLDEPLYQLPFMRAFLKRENFSYENEVRVVLGKMSGRVIPPGYLIRVNLDDLIQEVRVSPGEDKWFIDVVNDITVRYGFKFDILKTELDEMPLF